MSFDLGFILGAPRSGTTWAQQMIGAHAQVITPQETDFFSRYVPEWIKIFEDQLSASEELRRRGLPSVLTREELLEVARETTQIVFAPLFKMKPSATMLVEKTPSNSRFAPLLAEIYPQARFVHIIRDGRDVAASLMRASKGWGKTWAARTVEGAAERWRVHVDIARSIRHLSDRYMEFKYEDLLEDPSLLYKTFEFLRVDCSEQAANEIYESFTFENRGAASSIVWAGEARARFGSEFEEPVGFFGKGGSGSWRESFGAYDRVAFDSVAGDLLKELGYADDSWTQVSAGASAVAAPVRVSRDAGRRLVRWWRLVRESAKASDNRGRNQ